MRAALDSYYDNPVIDELVSWLPANRKWRRIRASFPMLRKPFIEVTLANGNIVTRHFPRSFFDKHWAKAVVILETLMEIEIVSEFDYDPVPDRESLEKSILSTRQSLINGCLPMFDNGMYEQFLKQFGSNHKNLPEDVLRKMIEARKALRVSTG